MKKIIVADDDSSILEVIKIILEDAGYEITTVSDPSLILSTVAKVKPNLVLLDIWMSGFDGRNLTKKLKSQNETKQIPVVIISAHNDTAKMAKEAQADGYLAKPFDMEDLVKTVKKYLN